MTILNGVIRVANFFNRGYKSIIYDKKNNRYFDLTSAGGTSLWDIIIIFLKRH